MIINFIKIKFYLKNLIKNPQKIILIFNLKILSNKLKDIFNAQVSFKNLSNQYQCKVLFKSIDKINEFNKKFSQKKTNKIISNNKLRDLRSIYINSEDYKSFENLFEQNGSDKKKNYLCAIYYEIFLKNNVNTLLEIGLGTNNVRIRSNMGLSGTPGASLRAFAQYLNKSKIFGADIDKDILFETENIKTFYVDQLNVLSISSLKKQLPKLDLIIDDGLHQPDANLNVILELLDHLNENGIMVIEDIENTFQDLFEILSQQISSSEKYDAQIIYGHGLSLVIRKNTK
jgi:hypothetical protein